MNGKSLTTSGKRRAWQRGLVLFGAITCAVFLALFAVPQSAWPAAHLSGQMAGNAHMVSVRQADQAARVARAATERVNEPGEGVPPVPVGEDLMREGEAFTPPKAESVRWRLRILDAAVAQGPVVTVGDVAVPVGEIPSEMWQKIAARKLWLAPDDKGRPMSLSRPKLQQAVQDSLGSDFAALFLYPPSMVLQRGGQVISTDKIRELVVKTLTPRLAGLPGEVVLNDFRLPSNIFLGDASQSLELELPQTLEPGRINMVFVLKELDGKPIRRVSGSVFVECWAAVPSAAVTLNKGDVLLPEQITFIRKNLAYMRETPWDGRGGPWRMTRSVAVEQPILASDVTYVPKVARGDVIQLVYESQSVRLALKAEALSDGVTGETIAVRNLSSKREVYGQVREDGTVVIRPAFQSIIAAGAGSHTNTPGERHDIR